MGSFLAGATTVDGASRLARVRAPAATPRSWKFLEGQESCLRGKGSIRIPAHMPLSPRASLRRSGSTASSLLLKADLDRSEDPEVGAYHVACMNRIQSSAGARRDDLASSQPASRRGLVIGQPQ